MIIVVEGPSAVGKTSLLRAFPASQVVGEEWEALGIPRGSGPEKPQSKEAQDFWVELHTRRWHKLLETEFSLGNAYADTDPVKLYYNFALVKLGYMECDVFAPLLSLFLLHTRLAGMGVLLLSLSMFGAFIFGICGHFLLPGADNVLQIPSSVWRIPFQVTAVLLMVLQAAGTVVGVRYLYAVMRWKKASQAGPV